MNENIIYKCITFNSTEKNLKKKKQQYKRSHKEKERTCKI